MDLRGLLLLVRRFLVWLIFVPHESNTAGNIQTRFSLGVYGLMLSSCCSGSPLCPLRNCLAYYPASYEMVCFND